MGTDEMTLSEIVKQINNPDAPKEVFDHIYENQNKDMEFWRVVLKPEYFKKLKEKVLHHNESVVRPTDIIRGVGINSLVVNIIDN